MVSRISSRAPRSTRSRTTASWPAQDGLVQRRRVRMVAFGIVAVGILAGVEQQANDLGMSVLRSQGERAMARFGVRGREQTGGIVHET